MTAEMGEIIAHLFPGLRGKEIERCVYSVTGQAMFYRFAMPAAAAHPRRTKYPPGFVRKIAAHITEFSLGGTKRIAGRSRGKSVGAETACVRLRADWPTHGLTAFALLALSVSGCGLAKQLTRGGGRRGWSRANAARSSQRERGPAASTSAAVVSRPRKPGAPSRRGSRGAPASRSTRRCGLRARGKRDRRDPRKSSSEPASRSGARAVLLLPQTTAGGRYAWHSDPLTNSPRPRTRAAAGDIQSAITIRAGSGRDTRRAVSLCRSISRQLRPPSRPPRPVTAGSRHDGGHGARYRAVANAYFRHAAGAAPARGHGADDRGRSAASSLAPRRRYSSGRTTKNDLLVVGHAADHRGAAVAGRIC